MRISSLVYIYIKPIPPYIYIYIHVYIYMYVYLPGKPFIFQWRCCLLEAFTCVGSQKYLVRQRRNRTWGCVAVSTGREKVEERQQDFCRVLHSLSSDFRFSMEETFSTSQQAVDLPDGRLQQLVEKCVAKNIVIWPLYENQWMAHNAKFLLHSKRSR